MKKIINKIARRKVAIEERLVAGVVLTGAEVKAIRTRGIELRDALVQVRENQAFLVNSLIHPYPFAAKDDQPVSRPRKLLLNESELKKLIGARKRKLTIIPTACYTKGRWIKVELGIGKLKGKRQKKQEAREKELKKRHL